MAEYLMPNNDMLNIEEKQELFSVRNRMVNIGYNYGKKENCQKCNENEDMTHIWQVLPSHNIFLLQDVFLLILRASVWVLPYYNHI